MGSNLTIVSVPGDHNSLLSDVNVPEVAKALRAQMGVGAMAHASAERVLSRA